MKELKRSRELFEEAQHYLPGGVNSPVRAFKAVGGTPLFIKRGQGSRIYDEDGNQFIDYVASWGPLILGHAYPSVLEALKKVVERGSSFGAPTELETRLAQMICQAMPSMEMVRFVNSGTEATMSAIRLARAFTARNKIVKFSGCYHGHANEVLAKSGSGMATFGLPSSPGVTPAQTQDTLVAPYNDLESVQKIIAAYGPQVAAVIVEPVAGNMGLVLPKPGFLEGLRNITRESGSLLIFDEVITGFRVAFGGAQSLYDITPDLTCLGKIIGGGFPVGAYGGRREIMDMVAPSGSVYQAGTLSGNPVAMTAGIETLNVLKDAGIYNELEKKTFLLERGIVAAAKKAGAEIQVPVLGSMFTIFFATEPVVDYDSAMKADAQRYGKFFNQMLSRGIYLPPSQFETAFVSAAHGDKDIQITIESAEEAFASMIQVSSL